MNTEDEGRRLEEVPGRGPGVDVVLDAVSAVRGQEGDAEPRSVDKLCEVVQDVQWGGVSCSDIATCLEALKAACEKCTDGKMLNHLWIKCLLFIIKESTAHPPTPLRPSIISVISLCLDKLNDLTAKLEALLSTTPLAESSLNTLTPHFRFYSSQLIAIEKSYPGCALTVPATLAKTYITVKMLSDPILQPSWETTLQWKPRVPVFDGCIKTSLEAPEWKQGGKTAFLRCLLSPDATLASYGRFSAVCGILANPPKVDEALGGTIATQCIRYVLHALDPNTPNALPLSLAYAPPADGTVPAPTQATISLCVFCTHAPPSLLHVVEEALYTALYTMSPLAFIVTCEVWGYLRDKSSDVWVASSQETVMKLLLSVGDDRRYILERLKHVLRVLWTGWGSECLVEKLKGIRTVCDAGVLERLPRRVLQWVFETHKSVWLGILDMLSKEAATDVEALNLAACMLRVVRLRPSAEWAGVSGDRGCGYCENIVVLTKTGEQGGCTCPVLMVERDDDVSACLKVLWRHAKGKINDCLTRKDVTHTNKLTISLFEVFSFMLPVFPPSDLAMIAGHLSTKLAATTNPATSLAAARILRRISKYNEKDIKQLWCPTVVKVPKLEDEAYTGFVFLNHFVNLKKYLGGAELAGLLGYQKSVEEFVDGGGVLPREYVEAHWKRVGGGMGRLKETAVEDEAPKVKRRRMDVFSNGVQAQPLQQQQHVEPPAEDLMLRDVLRDTSRRSTYLSSKADPQLHAEILELLSTVTARYKAS